MYISDSYDLYLNNSPCVCQFWHSPIRIDPCHREHHLLKDDASYMD